MPDFYPTSITDESFVRGPGRLMYASLSQAFPVQINDIIDISTYAAKAGWFDVGATKGGVQIVFNNAEEAFDVDQVLSDIETLPTSSEMSIQTQFAEATLDKLALAWEGDAVSSGAVVGGVEKQVGFGPFDSYTRRRYAVGFRRPQTGKIRFAAFRKGQRAPQESTINFNKTGEQMSIPVRFRILPDTSVASVRSRFGTFFDQQ